MWIENSLSEKAASSLKFGCEIILDDDSSIISSSSVSLMTSLLSEMYKLLLLRSVENYGLSNESFYREIARSELIRFIQISVSDRNLLHSFSTFSKTHGAEK